MSIERGPALCFPAPICRGSRGPAGSGFVGRARAERRNIALGCKPLCFATPPPHEYFTRPYRPARLDSAVDGTESLVSDIFREIDEEVREKCRTQGSPCRLRRNLAVPAD